MELVRSASERISAALALNSLICRPAVHSSVDLPILGGRSDIALLVPANRHFLFFLAYEPSTDQQAACGPAKNATPTGDREKYLTAGMDGFVSKPILSSLLIAEIERLLGSSAR